MKSKQHLSSEGKFLNSKINSSTNLIYFIFAICLFLFTIALIALILAGISMTRTNNLSNDINNINSSKVDLVQFLNCTNISATLYQNSFTNNIILIDTLPICWTQIEAFVYVKLPLIIIADTGPDITEFLDLHILFADKIPFMASDVTPQGASSSVTVGAQLAVINGAQQIPSEIVALQLSGHLGQSFIYNFYFNDTSFMAFPAHTDIVIRGITVVYRIPDPSSVSVLNIDSIPHQDIIESIQTGKLPTHKK